MMVYFKFGRNMRKILLSVTQATLKKKLYGLSSHESPVAHTREADRCAEGHTCRFDSCWGNSEFFFPSSLCH